MATHYTILNNGGIHSKLKIFQPVFNIERQSWYKINSLDIAISSENQICKLTYLHIHE